MCPYIMLSYSVSSDVLTKLFLKGLWFKFMSSYEPENQSFHYVCLIGSHWDSLMEHMAVCIGSAASKHPSIALNGESVVVGHPCNVNM